MDRPPSKRHKGSENRETAFNFTFGEDEDFTQDDLNEIDIIASQAIIGDEGDSRSSPAFRSDRSGQGMRTKPLSRGGAWTNQTRASENICGNEPQVLTSKEMLDTGCPVVPTREQQYYSQLESQHMALKAKLKEVEEEILMRNGEIRVLRDSLRVAQQEKEAQRQAQLLREKEAVQQQNEKEKELSKRVQSLQSELDFKEAEVMEMRSRLQGCERGPRSSPRVLSAQLHHENSGSSTSPVGGHFVTKETFGAQLIGRTTPGRRPCGEAQCLSRRKSSVSRDPTSLPDPFTSPARPPLHHRGPTLLSLLLQQPLSPSNLGLCHLLCLSPDNLPSLLGNTHLSPVDSASSSGVSGSMPGAAHCSGFSLLQSTALSGLNMLALDQPSRGDCTGGVHLLPLLQHHVSAFCRSLESLASRRLPGPQAGSSLSGTPRPRAAPSSSLEEGVARQEQFGLAALRALCHTVALSPEAVARLLETRQGTQGDAQGPHTEQHHNIPGRTTTPPKGGLQSQHALLQRLLQLCDPGFSGRAVQREAVLWSSLETLCALLERAPPSSLPRLQCVLSEGNLIGCLSLSSSYQTVLRCVSVLRALSDLPALAQKLCSHTEGCVFLRLFQVVTSRHDATATEAQWALLEVEVVRFLSRVFTQRQTTCSSYQEGSCRCHSEVVQTLVVLLHRQWLDIRAERASQEAQEEEVQRQTLPHAWCSSPGVQLLRESLVLLHWLMLHQAGFMEQLRPVLHMYDQALPAVRDTMRRLSDLQESEELALEELCRSESDDIEDMDTDTGS